MWYLNHVLFGLIIGLIAGALLNAERANKYKRKHKESECYKNWYKERCEILEDILIKESGVDNEK